MKYLFIGLLLLVACSSKPIKPEDLEASWQGHFLLEVEEHPLYSSLPREKRMLDNGEYFLNFTRHKEVTEGGSCVGAGFGFGGLGLGNSVCGEREHIQEDCVYQFLLDSHNQVRHFRVLGNDCEVSCKLRPHGSC